MSLNTPSPSDREPTDAERADEALIRLVMSVLSPEQRGPAAVRVLLAAIAGEPSRQPRGRANG
jgi:hypothetical protein